MINVLKQISHQVILNALEMSDMEVDQEDSFLALSIATCIQKANLENNESCTIFVDSVSHDSMVRNLDILKELTNSNTSIVITNSSLDHKETTERVSITTTDISIVNALEKSKYLPDLIILCDPTITNLENLLSSGQLQNIKKTKTKVFITHDQNVNATNTLMYLKKYNVHESSTVINEFTSNEQTRELADKITMLNIYGITKQSGYYVDEPVIRQMLNNTYFDRRFNAFGLHHKQTIEGQDTDLIAFDYELHYAPKSLKVYKLINSTFSEVLSLKKDPFAPLTHKLKSEAFSDHDNVKYISLQHKENAVNIRLHFDSLIKERIRNLKSAAKDEITTLSTESSKELINVITNNLSPDTPKRNATTQDVASFRLYHHFSEEFAKNITDMPIMYHAKDLMGSELIFEIAKHDNENELLEHYLQQTGLNPNPNMYDAFGVTLLETAIDAKAFKNIDSLLAYGADVNFQNPLGSTALHRAYANECAISTNKLNRYCAKQLTNIFGKKPADLMSQGFEKEILLQAAS